MIDPARARATSRAFTIVETVVAIGLLSLAMLGLMAAETTSAQVRTSARQREILNRALQDYTTELREKPNVAAVRNEITTNPTWITPGQQVWHTSQENLTINSGMVIVASNVTMLTEAQTKAALGGAGDYDFDHDGTLNSATSDPANYESVIPVQFTVSWTNTLSGSGQVRTQTFTSLVYPAGASQ